MGKNKTSLYISVYRLDIILFNIFTFLTTTVNMLVPCASKMSIAFYYVSFDM
uniref:Uncharacterized protein n=1 Tax=Anguilla anguilla TaxID=7936 RepID=A0A0E9STS3_ANGAN